MLQLQAWQQQQRRQRCPYPKSRPWQRQTLLKATQLHTRRFVCPHIPWAAYHIFLASCRLLQQEGRLWLGMRACQAALSASISQSIAGAMAGFGKQLPMPGLTFSNQAPITSGPVSAHAVKQDAVQMLKSQLHR